MQPLIIAYMAHPVRGDVTDNLLKAKAWLKRLNTRYGSTHRFIAPWITECEVFDDSDDEQRETALQGCCAVVARCDEIWTVGSHVSEGMQREVDHGIATGCIWVDLCGK